MTNQVPYADYVRIEIHKDGNAEIVELRPDKDGFGNVRAEIEIDEPLFGDVGRTLGGGVSMTLKVAGPSATRIFRDVVQPPCAACQAEGAGRMSG